MASTVVHVLECLSCHIRVSTSKGKNVDDEAHGDRVVFHDRHYLRIDIKECVGGGVYEEEEAGANSNEKRTGNLARSRWLLCSWPMRLLWNLSRERRGWCGAALRFAGTSCSISSHASSVRT